MSIVYWGQASGSSGHRTAPEPGGAPFNLDGQLNVSHSPSSPWQYVYRMFNASWAEIMAQRMIQFVKNPNIGYSQAQRQTFWMALEAVGWVIEDIPASFCDCSSLTFACTCLAAKEFRSNWRAYDYTGYNTSQFDSWVSETELAYKLPFTGYQMIRRGDILWRTGHCAIALNTYIPGDPVANSAWGAYTAKGGLDSSEQIPLHYHAYVRDLSKDGHLSPTPLIWARAQSKIYAGGYFKDFQPMIHT